MLKNDCLVLGFSEYAPQCQRLAAALEAPCELVHVHRFPDDESLVRLPPALPAHVVLCRSLDHPNDKLVELMLAATTARELGARRITLVAPYLCYMRQDIAHHPGEAVSQRIVGRFLAEFCDDVITVDPHLHRVATLGEAIPVKHPVTINAAPAMGAFLANRVDKPLLFGPDEESEQWVSAIAQPLGLDFAVAKKQRLGDRDVRIRVPEIDVRGREVILVDDVASTGHTLAALAEQLQQASAVHALVTHALFTGDAYTHIQQAGIRHVWSTDSITHPSNAMHLDQLLAQAVRDLP